MSGVELLEFQSLLNFLKEKEEAIVIDKKTNTASEVAGGIINPIVFRRTTKSWRIDEMLPKAINFYKQLEVLFHQQFISLL